MSSSSLTSIIILFSLPLVHRFLFSFFPSLSAGPHPIFIPFCISHYCLFQLYFPYLFPSSFPLLPLISLPYFPITFFSSPPPPSNTDKTKAYAEEIHMTRDRSKVGGRNSLDYRPSIPSTNLKRTVTAHCLRDCDKSTRRRHHDRQVT